MRFIQHTSCNSALGAPPGVKIDDCRALPIRRGLEPVGEGESVDIVQSFWRPEPEELKALNEGHPIMLTIWGRTHAPLRVEVAAEKD